MQNVKYIILKWKCKNIKRKIDRQADKDYKKNKRKIIHKEKFIVGVRNKNGEWNNTKNTNRERQKRKRQWNINASQNLLTNTKRKCFSFFLNIFKVLVNLSKFTQFNPLPNQTPYLISMRCNWMKFWLAVLLKKQIN
jgi:hypothetical protein